MLWIRIENRVMSVTTAVRISHLLPPEESQSPKVLVDDIEETLSLLEPEGNVASLKVLHVVGTLHVIVDQPLPVDPNVSMALLHTSGLTTWSHVVIGKGSSKVHTYQISNVLQSIRIHYPFPTALKVFLISVFSLPLTMGIVFRSMDPVWSHGVTIQAFTR